MKLNKTWKIVLGLVTLWVVLYPFIYVLGMFATIPFFIALADNESSFGLAVFFTGFMILMIIMVFSSFLQIGTSAFYIAHIIKNKKGMEILRIILGIGSVYLPYVALPVYYFIYIWPDTPPDWALEKTDQVE